MTLRTGRIGGNAAAAVIVIVIGAMTMVAPGLGVHQAAAADAGPSVLVSPAPVGTALDNGQTVSVSVGPNSTFAPNSRIVILECAAPGGVPPVNDNTCDGNTVQYGSVLVAADGSFESHAYRIYQLPNRQLSETPGGQPVCNASAECILYVGVDQNDFTQPKTFSEPFTVAPSATPVPSGQPGSSGSAVPTGAAAGAASGSVTRSDGGETGLARSVPPGGRTGRSPAEAGSAQHPPAGSATAGSAGGAPPSASHRDPPAGTSQGGFVFGGSAVLWLLIGLLALTVLAFGAVRLRRRLAP